MRAGKKMTPAMKLALLRVEQAMKKREQAQRVWDEACLELAEARARLMELEEKA